MQNKQIGSEAVYCNKVEICGVNTARLPILSDSQKTELLKKSRGGDLSAREQLIFGNLRLVLSVVQKFSNRGENPDDLFQVGCIGLMKAIDNFNPDLQVRFSTYGVPMIIGEIRRFLRDNNAVRVSRSMRDTAYRAMQAKEKLIHLRGKEPTVEEIAAELDCKKEEVVLALESVVDPVSLYEPIYSDGGDTIFVMDQVGDCSDDRDWLEEISFRDAVRSLGEREKKILTLRFLSGFTQTEVAKEIGISQAQGSRLEKNALDYIKSEMGGAIPPR